jgi:hypothetical protein
MTKDEAITQAIKALREYADRCEAELRLRGRSAQVREALHRKAQQSREAAAVLSASREEV